MMKNALVVAALSLVALVTLAGCSSEVAEGDAQEPVDPAARPAAPAAAPESFTLPSFSLPACVRGYRYSPARGRCVAECPVNAWQACSAGYNYDWCVCNVVVGGLGSSTGG